MVIRGKLSGELFIFNILSVCFTLVDSNFNVEEIYGVKYGFQISREPVLLKEVRIFRDFSIRQWCNATFVNLFCFDKLLRTRSGHLQLQMERRRKILLLSGFQFFI